MTWTSYLLQTLVLGGACLLWSRRHRARLPYPPGPPAEPLIGHARIIPTEDQEVVFREWSKTYGDIFYLYIPGRSFLVLNSRKAATELLEKRSGLYSDRMRFTLFYMMGWEFALTFMSYGKRFQKHRKLMNEYFHEKQSLTYAPLQTQQARRLLVGFLDNPDSWQAQITRFGIALIVKIIYGIDIVSDDDPYLDITTKALSSFTTCGSAGGTPVDFFPFLKYFPSWFPGTYYAFKARSLRPHVEQMFEYPYKMVKQQMKEGKAQPSYLSHHMEQLRIGDYDQDHIYDIRATAGTLLTGGAETVHTSVLLHFVLSMVLFPEVQRKAQAEIDRVIGRGRLPELSDRGTLPYVEAVMKETLRWNTVAPGGIPHNSTDDDVYEGMFIPKGTIVIYNAYAILRDESVYSNPDDFNPDRYLPKPEGNEEPSPLGQFGYGRRICPGRYFAEASLWIVMASILATFNIERALDEMGREIIPEVDLEKATTSHPKPFPCIIKPRDELASNLVRQAQLWDDV